MSRAGNAPFPVPISKISESLRIPIFKVRHQTCHLATHLLCVSSMTIQLARPIRLSKFT